MNRIVLDPAADRTHVVSAVGQRVLSGGTGRIVDTLRHGDAVEIASVRASFPQACAAIDEAGWLGPNWTFRTVPRSPHLKRLQVEVSLRCNLHCPYCYSTSGPDRRERLSPDEVLSIVREADAMGALAIDFTGGEFLLDSAWRTYVEAARGVGLSTSVHTNGTLISDDVAATLKQTGVRIVQVSLDSHLREIHDSSRGRPKALERTLRGLDILSRHDLPTRLAIMAHKANIGTIGDTIRFMRARYPKASINIDRVVATGGALDLDSGLTSREFWSVVSPFLSASVQAGRVCDTPGLDAYEPECGVAYSLVYITAQGEVAACPTMTGREGPQFLGPAYRETGLTGAWYDSEFFNSFRGTNCENVKTCPAGSHCGGGCRSNAYVESGRLSAPDVFACNVNKNGTKVFVDFPALYTRGDHAVPAGDVEIV